MITYQQIDGTSAGTKGYQEADTNKRGKRWHSPTAVKNFKPSDKATGEKHSDGQGLYLHVKPAGKYWRMSYRFAGKQKLLSLGVYPAVSLAKLASGG
ncbi:Arm DNA-binding domain-containing protein [Candidatus Skiveiella danica]|uniref:Arm DNA-binding domain-containing protein n=1 Tax=Candidatus Skiveiella danica TaxID=3386177 RepID=UPI0039B932DD